MQQPGTPVARGHLRLASAPAPRRRAGNPLAAWLRAFLAVLGVAWLTAAGWLAASVALLPLVWRRAPAGHRLRRRSREARIIPFQPRRQALPR